MQKMAEAHVLLDLNTVRELLIQRLSPDFSRSAIGNHDNLVSLRVCVL